MKLIKPNIIFRNSLRPLPKQNVKYIVIHHAEASKATWQDIHRWHQERGWAGAGYHEYITKTGEVYLKIPAQNLGKGKVLISLKGTNHELYAITNSSTEILSGELIKVVDIKDEILIVEKI